MSIQLHESLAARARTAEPPGETAMREAADAAFDNAMRDAGLDPERGVSEYRRFFAAGFMHGFAQGSAFSSAFTKAISEPQ